MGLDTLIIDILRNFYGLTKRTENSSPEIARGLGTHIKWKRLQQGLKEAKENGRPIMVVIHRNTCGACKVFKPKVANSPELARLSSGFVMINLENDEDLVRNDLKPDGRYVPRVIFLNPWGSVLKYVINRNRILPEKYYYQNIEELVSSMVYVLNIYPVRS